MSAREMQPRNSTIWREIHALPAAILIMAAACAPVRACLRATLDERAIQWATLIVQAKLQRISDAVDMGDKNASYLIYTFEVSASLDGNAKANQKVQVLRLIAKSDEESGCAAQFSSKSIG